LISVKYSVLVLLGAVSYGILSTIVKLAYEQGFDVQAILGGQFLFGWLIVFFLMIFFSRRRVSMKAMFQLMGVGVISSLVGVFYYSSLKTIPASISIVLLFQFTWIGVLLEAISLKVLPSREKLFAIILLLLGTMLAGNIFDLDASQWTLTGTMFGLLSGVCFAFFIFFSGKVQVGLPFLTRSFYMVTGGLLAIWTIFPPTFLLSNVFLEELWRYTLPLGIFGMVIPTLFFSLGVPQIGSGLGTIIGSAELPTVIILSVYILHEPVSMQQWLGVVLILIGIAIPQVLIKKNANYKKYLIKSFTKG
jgi:drug/metabolite transporter (DMT)-like permease